MYACILSKLIESLLLACHSCRQGRTMQIPRQGSTTARAGLIFM
jgi:hypothetical protein